MPIVTAAKRGRKVSWRCNISVAVQNVTDLVRIFLVHTCQRQFCETFCSRSIKVSRGRLRGAFLTSRVFSRSADDRRRQNYTNKILQIGSMKSEVHAPIITL